MRTRQWWSLAAVGLTVAFTASAGPAMAQPPAALGQVSVARADTDMVLDSINTIGIMEHPDTYFTVKATGANAITISETSRNKAFDAKVAAIAGVAGYTLKHVHVARSWATLDTLTHQIAADRVALAKSGVTLAGFGPDMATNTVLVNVAGAAGTSRLAVGPDISANVATVMANRYGIGVVTIASTTASVPHTRAARNQDEIEFSAGNKITAYAEDCTSGFSVVKRSSAKYQVLTAGHCGSTNGVITGGVPGRVDPANVFFRNGIDDFESIDPYLPNGQPGATSLPLVWTGKAGETTTYRILGFTIPAMNTKVTTDGAKTALENGQQPNNVVTAVNQCLPFDAGTPGNPDINYVCGVYTSTAANKWCIGGDSGGPVYVPTVPAGGAQAAGLIVASEDNDSRCYWQSMNTILGHGGFDLKVSYINDCATKPFPHSVCKLNEDGRQEVFWTGTATTETNPGTVMHKYQFADGTWHAPASMSSTIYNWLNVGVNGDGRLEVFGQNSSHALQHAYQNDPNSGWSSWYSLGCTTEGCFTNTTAPAVTYPGGQICVGGMKTANGHTHLIGQVQADSGWKSWDTGC